MSSGVKTTVAHKRGVRGQEIVDDCLASLSGKVEIDEVLRLYAAVNQAVCGNRLYRQDRFCTKFPEISLGSGDERVIWIAFLVLYEQGYTAFPAHIGFTSWLDDAQPFLNAPGLLEV